MFFLKVELPVVEPCISSVSKVLVLLVGESLAHALRVIYRVP